MKGHKLPPGSSLKERKGTDDVGLAESAGKTIVS